LKMWVFYEIGHKFGVTAMNSKKSNPADVIAAAVAEIGLKAQNLFLTRQRWCSEAVFIVLNQGLRGGLPVETAVRLASGLGEGLGGRGCICGALNGGVLALGLFLGTSTPGWHNGKRVRTASSELHDFFRQSFGATCCRVLTKDVPSASKEHRRQCALRTARTAEETARIILRKRPELVKEIDWTYLNQRDSRVGAALKVLSGALRP
jgi:C_GCAxxG_C_C family probable redox protein